MKKKLVKVGGSRALVIDNAILKLLGIKKGDEPELILEVEGGSLIVTPVREVSSSAKATSDTTEGKIEKVSDDEVIQKSFEKVMKKYAFTLRRLAKH